MSRYVSRADLARLLSVSRAAITKRCQGTWAAACRGDRVSLDHPLIAAALAAKGVAAPATDRAPTKPAKPTARRGGAPTAKPAPVEKRSAKPTKGRREAVPLPPQPTGAGSPEDLEQLAEVIRPLVARFGTERGFRDWLLGLKDIEVIDGKRLDNARERGAVYPRDFVRTHVLGLINGGNLRLLGDMPKTLCRELYALARTGRPLEEAERLTRKLIGKQLQNVRAGVDKAIKNADAARGHSGRSGQPVGGGDGADGGDDAAHPVRMGRK